MLPELAVLSATVACNPEHLIPASLSRLFELLSYEQAGAVLLLLKDGLLLDHLSWLRVLFLGSRATNEPRSNALQHRSHLWGEVESR